MPQTASAAGWQKSFVWHAILTSLGSSCVDCFVPLASACLWPTTAVNGDIYIRYGEQRKPDNRRVCYGSGRCCYLPDPMLLNLELPARFGPRLLQASRDIKINLALK